MNEKQMLIDSIRKTLEGLKIEATVDNMDKLLACHQALNQLREEVADAAQEKAVSE